jgi:hypothetical protein
MGNHNAWVKQTVKKYAPAVRERAVAFFHIGPHTLCVGRAASGYRMGWSRRSHIDKPYRQYGNCIAFVRMLDGYDCSMHDILAAARLGPFRDQVEKIDRIASSLTERV